MTITLRVNGKVQRVDASPDTPLLYALRNDLKLNGPKYGCGMAQCGACTVLVAGEPARSCVIPCQAVVSSEITTLEGLGSIEKPSVLQQAFISEQAAQCGYCINGMVMTAEALLKRNPNPNEVQVREALAGNLCRCGTHNRIVKAVLRASKGASK